MSWKFGGIYLKNKMEENPEMVTRFLGIDKKYTLDNILFSEAIKSSFYETAIGFRNGISFIQDNLLPYNNHYETGKENEADKKLIELSKETEMISFFLDDNTGTYGFAHFKDGQRIRQRFSAGNELKHEIGKFNSKQTDEEARMLEWIEAFTGVAFKTLLFEREPWLFLYTDTGF